MRSVPRCSLADVISLPAFILKRERISASRYSVPFFSWMIPTRARGPGTRRNHPAEERNGVSRCRNPFPLENESGKRDHVGQAAARDGPHPEISGQEGASERASGSEPGRL